MTAKSSRSIVTTMGIDIGKNTFHVIGMDPQGAIVRRPEAAIRASRPASEFFWLGYRSPAF